jgi:hypothetical protein
MANNSRWEEFSRQHWGPYQNDSYKKAASMTTVDVRELHERKNGAVLDDSYWQPGFLARFPWIGFGAVSVMLTCISLSIVVLTSSDNKAQEDWPGICSFIRSYLGIGCSQPVVPLKWKWVEHEWKRPVQLSPSVALAVINTVSNLSLAIAIGQGVVIAWWRQAMKGATIAELQDSWGFSTSVLYFFTAGMG